MILPASRRALPASRTLVTAALPALAGAGVVYLVLTHPRIASELVGRATPALLLLAAGFGVLIIRYSAAGVPLLTAFVFMNLSEALVRYHQFPSLLQLLVVALAVAAWLKRDTARVEVIGGQFLVIALTAYMIFAFASTSWAEDRHLADDRFGALARAFALFALATLMMRNRRRVRQGVYALVGAASLLGVVAIVQAVTRNYQSEFGGMARVKQAHIYGEVFEARAAGPIGDPNFFAQILLLAIPVAVMLAARESGRTSRLVAAAAAAVLTITLLLTYSRGAIIALAVVALLLLGAFHVRWRSTVLAVGALAALLVLLPPAVTQRVFTVEEIFPSKEAPIDPDSSFAERRLLMSVAWKMFTANPLAGVGVGNYSAQYDDYVPLVSSDAREYPSASELRFPHNLLLEIGAEGGVIGLALFATVVVVCWRTLRRVERTGDRELATWAYALRLGLIGFLVASVFLHLAVPRHLFLLFAFAASLERIPVIAAEEEAT